MKSQIAYERATVRIQRHYEGLRDCTDDPEELKRIDDEEQDAYDDLTDIFND